MKVAIVTGSSAGIGQEAACDLAQKGYHVVYACRNKEKAEKAMEYAKKSAPGAQVSFMQLDTGKMKSVKAFAAEFLGKFDRLDALVNNAGSGYFLKADRTTEDGHEAFFQTNYLGPFLLTQLLKDLLKKSGGRIVNVTSIEHWEGSYNFEKAAEKTGALSYGTSKLMCMLIAFEFCRREGIPAAAVNPGGVMSGIWWYLRGWKKTLWNMIAPLFLLTTKQGAQTLVHAATAENLPMQSLYYTPYKQISWCPYYSDMVNMFNGPTAGKACPKAYREEHGKKLWEFSMEKIKPYL